jgi:hypothetical protein
MALKTWPLVLIDKGDFNAINMQAIECLNAETKRTATSNASKRIEQSSEGEAQVGPRTVGAEGPLRKVETTGYRSSLSQQVISFLLSKQWLRRSGEGISTRRSARLFGVLGKTGRGSKVERKGVKLGDMGAEYDPAKDTAIKAYVRRFRDRIEGGDITWRSKRTVASC